MIAAARPLLHALSLLREDALAEERSRGKEISMVPEAARPSACNLAHYLSLRQHDLRDIQKQLAALGLSSLGRCEAHTMAALDAVTLALGHLAGVTEGAAGSALSQDCVDFDSGPRRLDQHTNALFGPPPRQRNTRIMVTMASEAATDPGLIEALVASGMNVMRINCAHDDEHAWRAMVGHLRRAEKKHRRACKVLVDLAGPKLRTGQLQEEPGVLKVKPGRDERGGVVASARVVLVPEGEAPPADHAGGTVIPVRVAGGWPSAGKVFTFEDARGRKRKLHIEDIVGSSCLCSLRRTTYFSDGLVLASEKLGRKRERVIEVGTLPPLVRPIQLAVGDRLVITKGTKPGHPAIAGKGRTRGTPAHIPCTLPQVFRDARAGEAIWLDDGKLGGIIRSKTDKTLTVEITHAPEGGAKLHPDKGINLPDSNLRIPGLTDKDRADLAFAMEHADMVGLSFVQEPSEVVELQRLLGAGPRTVGIVLKIETRRAFEALPNLLLAGLRAAPLGVMVARGDLAVEVGFLRMAEVQEEILWLCEAAHVPVVWATQVLESLAKKGAPSRAEVTDAAMGVRAECVMLNKGPHIVRTVDFLADILQRMQAHQHKKTTRLRRLSVADNDHAPPPPRAAGNGVTKRASHTATAAGARRTLSS